MSHTRDIQCRLFKNRVIYTIPTYFGEETPLGRAVEVVIDLPPKQEKKFDLGDLKKPLSFQSSATKRDYTTTVELGEKIPQLV